MPQPKMASTKAARTTVAPKKARCTGGWKVGVGGVSMGFSLRAAAAVAIPSWCGAKGPQCFAPERSMAFAMLLRLLLQRSQSYEHQPDCPHRLAGRRAGPHRHAHGAARRPIPH